MSTDRIEKKKKPNPKLSCGTQRRNFISNRKFKNYNSMWWKRNHRTQVMFSSTQETRASRLVRPTHMGGFVYLSLSYWINSYQQSNLGGWKCKCNIMFAFNNADLPCFQKEKHIKLSSLLKMIKNVISVDLQSSYIYHVSMETNSGTYDFY